jgi:hypothetical protein
VIFFITSSTSVYKDEPLQGSAKKREFEQMMSIRGQYITLGRSVQGILLCGADWGRRV